VSAPPDLQRVARAAETLLPESAEAVAAEIARAHAAGQRVLPAGHGSRLGAAGVPREADVILSTRSLGRVLQYEPDDLTITVEAGCTLAELDRVLAERGQVLPLQPGRARGTVGGLVATAPEGATSLAYGGVRDSLTGLRAALADGTIVKGGGCVVKNVAGYGVHRLMAGSHGTLGVIVEASFKVRPKPDVRGTLLFEFHEGGALRSAHRVLEGGLEPVFVDAVMDVTTTYLVVGFEGVEERVAAHLQAVVDLVGPFRPEGHRVLTAEEDASVRRLLDDWSIGELWLPWPPVMPEPSLLGSLWRAGALRGDSSASPWPRAAVRVTGPPELLGYKAEIATACSSTPTTRTFLDLRPGTGSAYVILEFPTLRELHAALAGTLDRARAMRLSAAVLAAPPEVATQVDVWGPPPPDFFLMKKIKQALDPDGVFAPGGFVGGL
jgi:glycolate oxidase FAD binding subunit